MQKVKSYKGFNEDMTCKGDTFEKQYEENKLFEEPEADVCHKGMHACEYPLDCFSYYAPATSVYHEVKQSGTICKSDNDSKVSSTKMYVGARLDIAGMVKAAIEFTMSKVNKTDQKHNTGDYGASSNTGNRGASSNTGYCGASSNTGYRGASSNTGDYGASSNTGNCGASSNTGYRGSSEAGHENSIAVAWGPESKAKGVKGSYLVLAEWKNNGGYTFEEDTWTFAGAKMVRVDGTEIKENTFYMLKDGVVTEVGE